MTQDIDIEKIALEVAEEIAGRTVIGNTLSTIEQKWAKKFARRLVAAVDKARAEQNPPDGRVSIPIEQYATLQANLAQYSHKTAFQNVPFDFKAAMEWYKNEAVKTYPPAQQSTVPDGMQLVSIALLEALDRKAEAGLCQMTHSGTREFLKDIRNILAAAPTYKEKEDE